MYLSAYTKRLRRAMVAARLATMQQGERINLEPSANFQKMSQSEAADLLNDSTRAVTSAATVRNEGTAGTVIETATATKY